jgi:hypothetical protein
MNIYRIKTAVCTADILYFLAKTFAEAEKLYYANYCGVIMSIERMSGILTMGEKL